MKIKRLNKESFSGKRFKTHYLTNGCYDIVATKNGFELNYVPFDKPVEKSLEDEFFGEWLGKSAVAYGAFLGDTLLGFAEGAHEEWNNRFRISNICVFDLAARRRGAGTALIKAILAEAQKSGARWRFWKRSRATKTPLRFTVKTDLKL